MKTWASVYTAINLLVDDKEIWWVSLNLFVTQTISLSKVSASRSDLDKNDSKFNSLSIGFVLYFMRWINITIFN